MLFDRLDDDGILLTKRGKPVAKLIPVRSGCARLIGSMKGRLEIQGNILSTGCRWSAESRIRENPRNPRIK